MDSTSHTILVVDSNSPTETLELGRRLGARLRGGDVLLLSGQLGAGKSVLARGVGEALGVKRWRGSPTFALINEYDTTPRLYHIDLYRLSPGEVEELGLEDTSDGNAILVVEWAERAESYLRALAPGNGVTVQAHLTGPENRRFEITAPPALDLAALAPFGEQPT